MSKPTSTFQLLWMLFGVDHESNGRDGAASRGWNRIFAAARFRAGFRLEDIFYFTVEPKAWFPWGVAKRDADGSGNPDLMDYIGYGQLTGEIGWHVFMRNGTWQDVNPRLLLRKGMVGSRGSAALTLRYRPPWYFTSISFYGEVFFGYGETLLRYNLKTTSWRFGFALDDRFSWKSGLPKDVQWPPPPPPP